MIYCAWTLAAGHRPGSCVGIDVSARGATKLGPLLLRASLVYLTCWMGLLVIVAV